MSRCSEERNPVELLAEDFMARKRRGEKPTLSEYTALHPDLADDIRELFPALLSLFPRQKSPVFSSNWSPQSVAHVCILALASP
jgi:hypothetical protein